MTSIVPRAPSHAPTAQTKNGGRANGDLADARLTELAYCDADAAFTSLESSRNGLTDDEVRARRLRYGRNEVSHEKPPTWYAQLARPSPIRSTSC